MASLVFTGTAGETPRISPDIINKVLPHQPPENDEGNREYKLKLDNLKKLYRIVSQLRFRLYEGDGRALYIIGVSDCGKSLGIEEKSLNDSLQYFQQACQTLTQESGDHIEIVKIRIYQSSSTPRRLIATVRVINKNWT